MKTLVLASAAVLIAGAAYAQTGAGGSAAPGQSVVPLLRVSSTAPMAPPTTCQARQAMPPSPIIRAAKTIGWAPLDAGLLLSRPGGGFLVFGVPLHRNDQALS